MVGYLIPTSINISLKLSSLFTLLLVDVKRNFSPLVVEDNRINANYEVRIELCYTDMLVEKTTDLFSITSYYFTNV